MRAQLVTQIRSGDRDPGTVAGRLWSRTAFPDHPYGRPTTGTEETAAAITPADLAAFHERAFARDRLLVVVVGAIDAETLGGHLDAAFGPLPMAGALTPVADSSPVTGAVVRETLEVPQTAIQFGLPGLKRHDPDYIPGFVMNHILGGGIFQSWLYQEVREKRGLVYGIYSFLVPYDHAGIFGGATSTRTDQAEEALAVILGQLERMADPGPTEAELEAAKDYLIGSYALRFDSSGSIAGQLLGIRLDDLGVDYVEERNDLIRAVTLEDVRRAAARLLSAGKPTIATVGSGGA
jgi:zinc protease